MLRKYFLAGILALLPVFLTGYITYKMFQYIIMLSDVIIPSGYLIFKTDSYLLNLFLDGLGYLLSILSTFLIIFITGVFTVNYFGKTIFKFIENIIFKIPLSRTIYSTIKQIVEVFLSKEDAPYKQVVMLEYPRKGIYSLGFLTNNNVDLNDSEYISVFIPTTPNPTSGFLLLSKKEDVIKLSITVEEAAKLIVSGGTIKPSMKKKNRAN